MIRIEVGDKVFIPRLTKKQSHYNELAGRDEFQTVALFLRKGWPLAVETLYEGHKYDRFIASPGSYIVYERKD